MKALYFSDIHLEIWENAARIVEVRDYEWENTYPLNLGPYIPPDLDVDCAILAGDIGKLVSNTANPINYADQLSWRLGNKPVIFVPGNHEYYGCQDFYGMKRSLENGSPDNVYILNNSCTEVEGVRIIGSTLWTDYKILGPEFQNDCMEVANKFMADHTGAIRKIGVNGGKKNFTSKDALNEFNESYSYIGTELFSCDATPTIIVTHHVPLVTSEINNPRYKVDATTSGFASHLTGLVDLAAQKGTKAWIFGHHHWSLNSNAFGVKMLSAQMGYPGEYVAFTNWQGPQILEI